MSIAEKNIESLGLVLPEAAKAVANYVGYSISGNTVIISGQLPMRDGALQYKGQVGNDVDMETARDAARLCGLNIIAQLKLACEGDLNRVEKCIRIGGFVNSSAAFTDHPKVINGVSDLMVDVFGPEIGRHARAAVGVSSLPLGAAVEVEATFLIK